MSKEGCNDCGQNEDTLGEIQTIRKDDLREGTRVHRYIILGLIGKGGMGAVYKAYDPELDRNIALKMLTLSPQQGQTVSVPQARLMREAQALAKLNHPNVVFVFDVGTYEEGVYIAMEYVEGKTFREWIKENHPTQQEVVEVMLSAGKGLQAAHREGVVHRDFKPENLLVGTHGQVKVLDFGLARAADFENLPVENCTPVTQLDSQSQDPMLSQPLTQVGTLIGTAAYMAPEHFLFQELDETTDQFSFCITLFEALYGQRPFCGNNQVDLAQNVTQGLIRVPSGVNVPDWIHNVIHRGLSVTKEDRFASMEKLLHELENDPSEIAIARRKKQGWFVLFVIVAMLPFVVWTQFGAAQEICTGAEKRRIGVWSADIKGKVKQAFVETNLAYAGDTFVRVEKNMDRYFDKWSTQYTSACIASRVHGEPVDIMVLKLGCLERQRKVVSALIDLFLVADSTVVAKAVRATSSLSDLSICQDVEVLQSEIEPPQDEQTKKKVALIRDQLFRVEAFERAGKYQEGLNLVQLAWTQAQPIRYPPVQAEVMFWLGFLQERVGSYVSARESLENAAYLSVESGHGEIRAKSLIQLLWVVGYRLLLLEEAMKLNRWTEAAVVYWGDREQESWWLNTLGLVLWKKGDFDSALAYIQKSKDMREKKLGLEHPDVAASLNNIALVLWQKGEFKHSFEYFQRSLQTFQATLGAAHPDVATCLTNLGSAYTHMGDYQNALKYLKTSLEIREKVFGSTNPKLTMTLEQLGLLNYLKKEYGHAEELYQRAHAINVKSLGPNHPKVAYSLSGLGWLQFSKGNHLQAKVYFENVLEICGKDQCKNDVAQGYPGAHLGLALSLWQEGKYRKRSIILAKKGRALLKTQHSALAKKMLTEVEEFLRRPQDTALCRACEKKQ